jgi:hypothetical protein
MKKNPGNPKSRDQKLARVINQMEGWMHDKTRLILSISTPLFQLFLRGCVVGRQERLFLFDSHEKSCGVPVIPEHYDRVLCEQKGPASVTFETSGMQGRLEMREDDTEADTHSFRWWMMAKTKKKRPLSPMKLLYVKFYEGNGKEAAEKAGSKRPKQTAYDFMKDPAVMEAIAIKQNALAHESGKRLAKGVTLSSCTRPKSPALQQKPRRTCLPEVGEKMASDDASTCPI